VPDTPQPVVLILADISGYTRFMTANVTTLAHSQLAITELLETIIRQVEIPLRVAKLEGDAVFLYAIREGGWPEARERIRARLVTFFETFAKRLSALADSPLCSCEACKQIGHLRLKVIAHAGEALLHRVAGFEELAGVDVILAHRLLKNSVAGNEYLLMTEPAWRELGLPGDPAVERSRERTDLGEVPIVVWRPGAPALERPPPRALFARVAERYRRSVRAMGKTIALVAGLRELRDPEGRLRFSPSSRLPKLQRVLAAAGLLLASPLLLLVVMPVTAFSTELRRPR
jgi:hypothetical protein